MQTQLLCTFTTEDSLEETLKRVITCYDVAFNSIQILENLDEEGALCCTYNVIADSPIKEPIPPSTISLHRKKQTNTLYTINALNKLVVEQNDGVTDKDFQVNWNDLRNMILVTQYGHLKKIHTKVRKIIKLDEEIES